MFLPKRSKREGESCCSLSLPLITNIGLKVISDLDRADWYLNLVSDFLIPFNETAFRLQDRVRSSINTKGQG